MEISSMQIGFDALLSILSALIGALTVWFTLKNKVAIQQLVLENIQKDLDDIKSDKKESHERLHKRIDDLKTKVETNREKNDNAIVQLRDDMAKMKIEIIEAIASLKNK